jgi:hypothetical protein
MKPGKEIARFEQRVSMHAATMHRVYCVSLRESGQTLFRQYSPNTPVVTSLWRRVRPWATKFPNLDAARADYLRRGYVEVLRRPLSECHGAGRWTDPRGGLP